MVRVASPAAARAAAPGQSRNGFGGARLIEERPEVSCQPAMKGSTLGILVTVAFSLVGVLGDYFLKLASQREQPLRTGWFYIGFALYASTAFGWVFVMRHLKLATISVVYSVSMVLLLTAVGVALFRVALFREVLNAYEVAGIVLALASLVLLIRFA
jgi:drug/metabolite transporter (DMT)-like permease